MPHKILSLDYFIFYLVLFSLPFGKSIFIPILFSWLCTVFLSYFLKRDYSNFRLGLLVLPILFYLLDIIGVVQSLNLEGAVFDMQVKLSLLLLPLLYPYKREFYKHNFRRLLWSFAIGCTVASLYYLGYAVFRSLSVVNNVWVFNPLTPNHRFNYFLSSHFSYLIHPSYFALYLLVTILIIGIELTSKKKKRFTKIILIISMIIILISLILLQSRAGILGLGLLVIFLLGYLVLAQKRYFITAGVLVVLLGLTYFVFTRFNRMSTTAKSLESFAITGLSNPNNKDGTTVRIWIWKSAFSIIKEHPVWGVGTGDVRDELQKQYEVRGMTTSAQFRHNAHNQYIETWLGTGIFGLLALLAMLFTPMWIGIKGRDWLLVNFLGLCSISFMFESMLNTIAGVGFFAIFYTILVSRLTDDGPMQSTLSSERG